MPARDLNANDPILQGGDSAPAVISPAGVEPPPYNLGS